ncbi:hypothetical protein [Paracoccus sp. pheM1]|uniref:hypothetical protein n=1 Tax=Paracoccus sp. pheM1 TaxID=2831675 RepID=UPI0011150BFB|nr:hypothetical protein [Paracoccus sp. pheM1]MBT0782044.1 hypothetical protein [Paracoccus sp. pheM1]
MACLAVAIGPGAGGAIPSGRRDRFRKGYRGGAAKIISNIRMLFQYFVEYNRPNRGQRALQRAPRLALSAKDRRAARPMGYTPDVHCGLMGQSEIAGDARWHPSSSTL